MSRECIETDGRACAIRNLFHTLCKNRENKYTLAVL